MHPVEVTDRNGRRQVERDAGTIRITQWSTRRRKTEGATSRPLRIARARARGRSQTQIVSVRTRDRPRFGRRRSVVRAFRRERRWDGGAARGAFRRGRGQWSNDRPRDRVEEGSAVSLSESERPQSPTTSSRVRLHAIPAPVRVPGLLDLSQAASRVLIRRPSGGQLRTPEHDAFDRALVQRARDEGTPCRPARRRRGSAAASEGAGPPVSPR